MIYHYYLLILSLEEMKQEFDKIGLANYYWLFPSAAANKSKRKLEQLEKDIEDIIEELCQCFQTTIPIMNCTSPIRSASSEGTLTGHHFLRSVAYLCAKQTIDLPLFITNNDLWLISSPIVNDQVTNVCVEEKVVDQSKESVSIWQSKIKEKHRSLDLSTIHETSFESDSIVNNEIQLQTIVKRQPLQEIDINTFNNEEREIKNDKKSEQNIREFILISDGDKENLPMIRKKRLMVSTKNEPPSKKHKKTLEVEQKK